MAHGVEQSRRAAAQVVRAVRDYGVVAAQRFTHHLPLHPQRVEPVEGASRRFNNGPHAHWGWFAINLPAMWSCERQSAARLCDCRRAGFFVLRTGSGSQQIDRCRRQHSESDAEVGMRMPDASSSCRQYRHVPFGTAQGHLIPGDAGPFGN
ncbi:hypothetical protein [Lentzea albidocapillata]|uniref:hypothetical protein n=1 Tax=Lentzea albidocapillata TaxID=40571 RepID=UPI00115FE404|nr:hypothetical protein [Lentzea albidocapillata]